jgi:hypothetical protein
MLDQYNYNIPAGSVKSCVTVRLIGVKETTWRNWREDAKSKSQKENKERLPCSEGSIR